MPRIVSLVSAALLLTVAVPAAALPVGVPAAVHPAAREEAFAYADYELYDRGRFVAELFSESASSALMHSLQRTQRLALGLAVEAGSARPAGARLNRSAVLADDPLAGALEPEALPAPARREPGRPDPAAGVLPDDFADGADPDLLEADREVLERVEELRKKAGAAVDWVLAPEIDAQGRRSYPLPGFGGSGGLRLVADEGVLARDAALRSAGALPADANRPAGPGWAAEDQRNAILRLMFQVWDLVTHPLTLTLVLLAGLLQAILSLARGRPAAG